MLFERSYRKLGLILAGGAFCTASLTAQSQKPLFDYEFLKNRDAWLTSENASGLNNLVVPKASFAEIRFDKNNGGFINYFESDNSYLYGALCESYYRLNTKTVVFGRVEYSQFSGENMGGSSSVDPYYNPINIVEYADSTAGRKMRETYRLVGALATKLTEKFSLGIKVDYTTISYYKTKDLRHINDWMDMILTGGVRYNGGRLIDAGINYFYRRSTEGISFKSVGKKDQQFNSLIDFGAFYGRQERFGESGYTYGDNLFFNRFHGVALQLNIAPGRKWHFFNELSAKFRNGYYGMKSSTSIVYTEHQSDIFSYDGVFSLEGKASCQQIALKINTEHLDNWENSYRKETPAGGNTTIVYYGKNKVLDQQMADISLRYTGNFEIENNNPGWTIDALMTAKTDNLTVTVYPAYREHEINRFYSGLLAKRNIYSKKSVYSLLLGLGYGFGTGYAAEDGSYGSSSSSQSAAVSLDSYLYREYEYLTAKRITGEVAFRYTRLLSEAKTRIYGEIGYESVRALSVHYIGNYSGTVTLKAGCFF